MMKFFDDIRVGDRIALGSHHFSAEEIKIFARQYDPQPFHVDEAEGVRSHFGALVASGWHTAALWMRKMVDYRKSEAEALRARGELVPLIGPSPGFRDMRWHKPVFVGDTVTYATEVIETRVSQSRPKWGLMGILNSGANQHGKPVISFVSTTFIERRDTSST